MSTTLSSRAPIETPTFIGATQTLGSEIITNAVDRNFTGAPNWVGTDWERVGNTWTHTSSASQPTSLDLTYCSVTPVVGQFYQITATVTTTSPGDLIAGFGGAQSSGGNLYFMYPPNEYGNTYIIPVGTMTCTAIVMALDTTSGAYFWPSGNYGLSWVGSITDVNIRPITYSAGASVEYLSPNDTAFGDPNNWVGTGWVNGVHDTAGANDYSISNIHLHAAPVAGNTYHIGIYKQTTDAGVLSMSFAGVTVTLPTLDYGYTVAITALDTSPFTITPDAAWTGTISEPTIKLVTPSDAILSIATNNQVAVMARSSFRDNFGFGVSALASFPNGANNVGFGCHALANTIRGGNNTAIGCFSLVGNTTGYDNTAVGFNTMLNSVTGRANTAVGVRALMNTNRGNYNTAVGGEALMSNTEGYENTALGYRALNETTTGNYNIGIGSYAARRIATANNNVGIGRFALEAATSGDNNVTVGNSSSAEVNGTSNNTAIGHHSYYVGNYNNCTCLGFEALPTADNQVILGDANITGVYSAGQFFSAGNVLARKVAVPASATAAGLAGDFAADATHVYFCVDTDTWLRASLSTWT
jgi:hypothetical protein